MSISILALVIHLYSGYFYLPQLQFNLYEPTPTRTCKAIFRSSFILLVTYSIITIIIYLDPPYFKASWMSFSVEMMLAFNLLALVPSTIAISRNVILDLFDFEPTPFV